MTQGSRLTVFFDGGCPLCAREIAFYRRRRNAGDIDWVDVDGLDGPDAAPGLTKARALGRFHVRGAGGRMVDGGEAFALLWSALPGFRWLGVIGRFRPALWCLNHLYNQFLHLRPWLQRRAAARARRCNPDA